MIERVVRVTCDCCPEEEFYMLEGGTIFDIYNEMKERRWVRGRTDEGEHYVMCTRCKGHKPDYVSILPPFSVT